jgi:hypothetical protein
MISAKTKYILFKEFVVAYEKRKIQSRMFLKVIKEILYDLESEYITKEKQK